MKLTLALLVAIVGPAFVVAQGGDTSCPGTNGQMCFSKAKKGWVADYFKYTYVGSGPCFTSPSLYGGAPSCFTSEGNMQAKCDCTKSACGCTPSYADDCPGPIGGMGSACGNNVCRRGELTSSEINRIVNKHNALRAQVASGSTHLPAAISMPNLVWDSDLAAGAQTWADQCQGGHDSGSARKAASKKSNSVGQNAAMVSNSEFSSNLALEHMIQLWYDEIKDTITSHIKSFPESTPKVIGHFTQVAWAKTTRVGCGVAQYLEDNMFTQRLICNYYPAGNFIGKAVYPTA